MDGMLLIPHMPLPFANQLIPLMILQKMQFAAMMEIGSADEVQL